MSSRSAFSPPNGFSSTPVKLPCTRVNDFHKQTPLDFDIGVLSDDEDTFSLLSPIYHDSFDSGENCSQSSRPSSPQGRQPNIGLERCELPKKKSDQILGSTVPVMTTPRLSAWEQWLLNKAKEDQIKSEKKAEEERILQEKKNQEEKEHEQKAVIISQRIQEWLKMKREQEKQEQLKQSREQETLNAQMEKQRKIEMKAQDAFKEWLQKKNSEKAEKQKKLKEEAVLKKEQEKERRRMAEEKFKEWLHQANTKNIVNGKPLCASPHGKTYPSPSFYNPIPWKPIHIPPSETAKKASDKNAQSRPKGRRPVSRLQYAAQQKR